jgi:O-antigen ligase
LLDAGWLVLLVVAVALSLTRTSMLASIGVLGLLLAIVWWDRRQTRRLRTGRFVVDAGRLVVLTAIALVGGIALNVVGTPGLIDEAGGSSGGGGGQAVIGRVVFSDETSGIQSIQGGRFTSYRRAIDRIARSPVIGLGLGALTPVDFAYDETRAHTVGQAAGVDNAYLTVALKGGIVAALVFAALVLAALLTTLRLNRRRRQWLLAGLAGIAVLTVTQSFATSLYGPAIVGILFVLPALALGNRAAPSASAAAAA